MSVWVRDRAQGFVEGVVETWPESSPRDDDAVLVNVGGRVLEVGAGACMLLRCCGGGGGGERRAEGSAEDAGNYEQDVNRKSEEAFCKCLPFFF